ncbi:DUF3108 domain-containing protein [Breoghania sp. L-A4]|nr:DUF3108 domain-containing protein [Breoghania sp. L-A4]
MAENADVGAAYDISIAGFVFAKGTLSLELQGDAYSARVGMRPSGLARIIIAGKSNAYATGSLHGTRVMPDRYDMISEESERSSRVAMGLSRGNVRDIATSPQLAKRPDRVPVTRVHQRGIVDPLSAILMPVANAGQALTPKGCDRRIPIFDGWTRYDVQLSYKSTQTVSGRGYDGPVIVCGARWVPVAGHRPAKKSVKYMADNRDIEIWLAPMATSDVLLPYRISMRTMTGDLVVQARKLEIRTGERKHASR